MNDDRHKNCEAKTIKSFERLCGIIKTLRGPDGCPWDKEQTVFSIIPNLIEESHEFSEAAANSDLDESINNMREELGDVFLVATMLGIIAQQDNLFNLSDSLNDISEKLIRRHPHVFSDSEARDSKEVITQWDKIKTEIEGKGSKSIFKNIPKGLPPILRAEKTQKNAAKAGFDWKSFDGPLEKIREETEELAEIITEPLTRKEMVTEEIGDLLFSVINLSRHLHTDPAQALQISTNKFMRRYEKLEEIAAERGTKINLENITELDKIWREIKDML